MNIELIRFHLGEALEALNSTIKEVETTLDYDIGEFRVSMSHLYHHLNSAWNGRDSTEERGRANPQEDFDAWRKFPENDDLLL